MHHSLLTYIISYRRLIRFVSALNKAQVVIDMTSKWSIKDQSAPPFDNTKSKVPTVTVANRTYNIFLLETVWCCRIDNGKKHLKVTVWYRFSVDTIKWWFSFCTFGLFLCILCWFIWHMSLCKKIQKQTK